MVFWKRNVFRHMKGFDPGKLERCEHTIQMKNDFQKQKQIESGSVNLDFYEAWKGRRRGRAEQEEDKKKTQKEEINSGLCGPIQILPKETKSYRSLRRPLLVGVSW